MSTSLRVYTVLALVVCALTLGLGIVIGYFIQASAETLLLPKDQRACDIGYGSHLPQVQRFLERNIIEACAAETCDIPLPRIYVSEHLYDEQIVVDGLLDETAWAQAPWSEKFVDLEGRSDKVPLLNTRVKLRWDDSRLYIGALLEGSHVWANRTQHDSDGLFHTFLFLYKERFFFFIK
ncbi:unnamed protein product [Acanthosepion pharaonis]|uniref:Uncharacterized protein n=1 Tax=Acanthosepion pharaonis TaxID=158019 RepID=A0A812D8H9_ACAPH|nr:unnamed protein product [Sepia pharaonis]